MIKHILVALSGTPYTPIAVERAIELAQIHGASVTGVTVVDLKTLSDVGPVPLGGQAAAPSVATMARSTGVCGTSPRKPRRSSAIRCRKRTCVGP